MGNKEAKIDKIRFVTVAQSPDLNLTCEEKILPKLNSDLKESGLKIASFFFGDVFVLKKMITSSF